MRVHDQTRTTDYDYDFPELRRRSRVPLDEEAKTFINLIKHLHRVFERGTVRRLPNLSPYRHVYSHKIKTPDGTDYEVSVLFTNGVGNIIAELCKPSTLFGTGIYENIMLTPSLWNNECYYWETREHPADALREYCALVRGLANGSIDDLECFNPERLN